MPTLALSTSHHQRRSGLPNLKCINMLWDGAIGAFFTRPALVSYQTKGTGPIRGMFSENGLFGSDKFYVSGPQFWRESAVIYTVPGADGVRFAGGFNGSDDCLVICTSGHAYRYDADGFNLIAIPDDTNIYDVVFFGNRFLFFAGNGKFYWSAINDPTTIDPLSFATAEAKPDGFVRAVVALNTLYIFGNDTTEPWYATTDIAAPFAPQQGSEIDMGAYSGDLVYENDGRVWFVSEKKQVWALSGGLKQIADDSVLESLSLSQLTDSSLCTVFIEGNEVLLLTDKAAGTYVYDGANWYRWSRVGRESLNVSASINVGSLSYVGDMSSGAVFQLDNTIYRDSDDYIERIVSGYVPLSSGRVRNANLSLQCARGPGNLIETDPQVEMRYSDDFGTYTDWDAQPLGKIGQFWARPAWRSLGMMQVPGRIFEFRCTDDVDFAPQNAVYNEDRL